VNVARPRREATLNHPLEVVQLADDGVDTVVQYRVGNPTLERNLRSQEAVIPPQQVDLSRLVRGQTYHKPL